MKRYLSAVALVLLVTATMAMGQAATSVVADVPFPFFVGKASFPAGTYEFKATQSLNEIRIVGKESSKVSIVPVTTRLSPRSESEGSIVFDLEGTNHHLSEIYIPGLDGFEVQGSTAKHTHVSIKGHK